MGQGLTLAEIAISGAGLVTGLGPDRESTWAAMRAGAVGLGPLEHIEYPAQADRGGGEVHETPEAGWPREAYFLKRAIDEALGAAGLAGVSDIDGIAKLGAYEAIRCGVMLGTTLHGMTAAGQMVRSGSMQPLKDFLAPAVIARATNHLPFHGGAMTTCSACSSGLGSILLGMTLLRANQLDLVICGGYDPISEYAYAGFNSLRLVDERLPRPFARDRAGMKVSEAYGIVILERVPELQKRGHEAFAYVRGGGESADAHHLTQPMQDGQGAAGAIRIALERAELQPEAIDLIVAHATGTTDNDAAEYAALSGVFGDRMSETPVAALKSRLGHTLGGAGAAELIVAALAMRDSQLPTTAQTRPADVDFKNLILSVEPQSKPIRATVNTSLGFGGANTCLILSQEEPEQSVAESPTCQPVWITGIGVLMPDAIGLEAVKQACQQSRDLRSGPVAEEDYLDLLNARRVRRLSDYVKLTLAASTLALQDAGLTPEHLESLFQNPARCGAILGTTHGSTHFSYDYYRGIVDDGIAAANPVWFAEGVPNAGAAHMSMAFRIRGACQSIIGSRTAGLDALRLAMLRISSGDWDRAIVCAGEEHDGLVERAYADHGLAMPTAAGAVTFLLESESAARERGADCKAVVEEGWQISFSNNEVLRGVKLLADRLHLQSNNGGTVLHDELSETWLGRMQRLAGRRSGVAVAQDAWPFAESFSVGPLARLAALAGPPQANRPVATMICGDFNGLVAGATVTTDR
jgi:3-oxoacyl-[acyl-carrier-protein] synthase II